VRLSCTSKGECTWYTPGTGGTVETAHQPRGRQPRSLTMHQQADDSSTAHWDGLYIKKGEGHKPLTLLLTLTVTMLLEVELHLLWFTFDSHWFWLLVFGC